MASKSKTPAPRPRPHAGIDQSVLGSILRGGRSQAFYEQATPKQWRILKTAARRRGISVEDLLNTGLPQPLKQRTTSSLRRQALSTVNSAYRPAESELNRATARFRAIDEKRAADNRYYLDWLAKRQDQMNAAAQASQQQVFAAQQQRQTQLTDSMTNARQQLIQDGVRDPNAVSDPAQFKGFDFTPEMARDLAHVNAASMGLEHAVTAGTEARAVADASNFAFMRAQEAKRQGDLWNKLADIADSKNKIKLQKAADAAKEVSRLLDQEIAKAQQNRNYDAAVSKLQIDASRAKTDAAYKAALAAIGQQNANTNQQNADTRAASLLETQRHNQRMETLGWFNANTRRTAAGNGSFAPGSAKYNALMDQGYAWLAVSELPTKRNASGKVIATRPLNVLDVRRNRENWINQIVAGNKGVTRDMASTIVDVFIKRNGAQTRPLRNWIKATTGLG